MAFGELLGGMAPKAFSFLRKYENNIERFLFKTT
jgi:hypothetical protein